MAQPVQLTERGTALPGVKGKNVLITGGSSGIGQAIAVRFAEYGANVAINYLKQPEEARETEEQVHACVHKVRQVGVQDVLVGGDVSDEADVVRMVGEAADALGGIDVLVNNARPARRPRCSASASSSPTSQGPLERPLALGLRNRLGRAARPARCDDDVPARGHAGPRSRDLRRGQVTLPALEIAPPSIFWGAKEIAIDALHHAVYAVTCGVAYAALARGRAD